MNFRLLAIPPILLLGSCAFNRDAASGINPSEFHALKEIYYWSARSVPPTFTQGELERLMDRSADPSLDGESAELQTAAVAGALATVGDETFAATLATRNERVQAAVIGSIRHLWKHYKLRYPKTETMALAIPQDHPD